MTNVMLRLEFDTIGIYQLARYQGYNIRIDPPAIWNGYTYWVVIYKPTPVIVHFHSKDGFKTSEDAQQYGQEWLAAHIDADSSEPPAG